MNLLQFKTLPEYEAYVDEHPSEINILIGRAILKAVETNDKKAFAFTVRIEIEEDEFSPTEYQVHFPKSGWKTAVAVVLDNMKKYGIQDNDLFLDLMNLQKKLS